MNCKYKRLRQTEPGIWSFRCLRCGHGRTSHYDDPEMLHRKCRYPEIPTKVLSRYAQAVAQWVAAGRPVRTDERVREIFNTICKPCEWYNEEAKSCRVCGCQIRDAEDNILGAIANLIPAIKGFTNKLIMATQSCPKGKWKAEVGKDQ